MIDGTFLLGPGLEPQRRGTVVAVHYGDYRRQEIWVSGGGGTWYPLGSEFWAVWEKQQHPLGVTKKHPEWRDVLARGPVTLLVPAGRESYRQGWRNGRRALWQAAESLIDDEPDGYAELAASEDDEDRQFNAAVRASPPGGD